MKNLLIPFLSLLLSCSNQKHPLVLMETNLGLICLELYPDKAPITVANFLRYVDENRYKDAHFYRVVHMGNQPNNDVKIQVIQGGLGFDNHPLELPPIIHETTEETDVRHKDGTISMARLEPGTANSEFFICINDQPDLDFDGKRNPDSQGFAAFGKVVSGMEFVRQIQQLPETRQMLDKSVKIINIEKVINRKT